MTDVTITSVVNTPSAELVVTAPLTPLVSTRVPFANSTGKLVDSANMTYATNRLSPTYITLAAGTATAGTAPLKLTQGTLLTVVENGSLEYDGDYFYSSSGTMTGVNHRRRVVSDDRVVSFNDEAVFFEDNLVLL